MNQFILGVTLMFAVYYDNRQNRIPNLLCGISIAAGMLYMVCFQEMGTLCSHSIWAVGVGLCFLPLWFGRILGGGDIKLFMTAGFLIGRDIFLFFMYAGVCLGVHACMLMIGRKNYFERMALFFRYVTDSLNNRKLMPYPFDREKDWEEGGIKVSYGLLAGHLMATLLGIYH